MSRTKPTDSELEILQILWQQGPSSVRYINDKLNQSKEVGYTTTLKIMQIMLDKGILSRDASQRQHVYKPLLSENDTKTHLLKEFINATFRGSAMNMVLQALGNTTSSAKELNALKALISDIESQNNI